MTTDNTVRLSSSFQSPRESRRGAMMVMVAVLMLAFLATVALSVDIAYMHLARSELRSATDAAAKAAAVTLARSQNRTEAVAAGQQIALENLVGNRGMQIPAANFQFGNSVQDASGRFVFNPNTAPFNSVRVLDERTNSSPLGGVPLFFGRALGASTFEPKETATAAFVERDVVLVVDRSGSMNGRKFNDLKASIRVFIAVLKNNLVEERVGLASYDDSARTDVALTSNLDRVTGAMDAMKTGNGTSISAGIDAGASIMNGSRSSDFVERTMIVMTDGLHNRGREPRIPAVDVAAKGIKIHTITFGSDADKGRMQEISNIGRGRSIHAATGTELANAFKEIANTLSTVLTQ